jgi:hypothetical protein
MELSDSKTIPLEAYQYWPKGKYLSTGSGKSIVRYIFYHTKFTDFELSQLSAFKSYLSTHAKNLQLPPFFCDEELLRVILGCKFDLKKSLDALISSIEWRSHYLKQSFHSLLPVCKDLLNSGCIYFHGRDCRFRPILVFNIARLDLSAYSIDSYCALLCFLLEYAVQKLLIPGQVENWVVLTDLNSQGLRKLPVSEAKRIIKLLQENFRCRMIYNYVVNAPSSIVFIWSIVKKFIEEHTINKIRILKESAPEELKMHCSRGQFEAKYGGIQPNATCFWPPIFPPGPFSVENDSIETYMSPQSTYELYNPRTILISEVSSNMDEVEENVEINLPIAVKLPDEPELKGNLTSISDGAKFEFAEEQEAMQIDIYEKINTTKVKLEENADKEVVYEELKQRYSIESRELEEKGEIYDYTPNTVPEFTHQEQKKSKMSRICKICTRKGCLIY